MGKDLKDDVSVRRPIPGTTKGRQTQRVRGIVGEIEPALDRVGFLLGVGKPREAGALQRGQLLGVRRLLAECLAGPGEILKRRGHARRRSATTWAAPTLVSRTHCPA